MKTVTHFLLLCIITVLLLYFSTNLYAAQYEYSDAPEPYGIVKHNTGRWQRLGQNWNREPSALQDNLDTSDDGVFWSLDHGTTWGHNSIYAGQEVMFGFEMTRAGYGIHAYDGLSAWVDWNSDGFWSDNENIIDEKWYKGDTRVRDSLYRSYLAENGVVINPDAELVHFFVTESFLVSDDIAADELWLRARVACSSSIYRAGGSITPYNNIHQGEVEDWKINVNPVPEPNTMLLLGFGLIGLAGVGRKTIK